MRPGVLYGVIAFGVVVGLGAFVHVLAQGWSLPRAAKVLVVLIAGLVLYPLARVPLRTRAREDPRTTIGVALLVFAFLVAVSGVIVGVVGKAPWLEAAAGLLAIAAAFAVAGAVVLRSNPGTPADSDPMPPG